MRSQYSWFNTISCAILIVTLSLPIIINPLLDSNFASSNIVLNSLSSPLIILSLILLPLIIIASQSVFSNFQASQVFLFLLVLLTLILILCFSAANILIFYIFFELSLIPTALLIMYWGYQPERIAATIYLLLYTITFSLPLLLALINSISLSANNSFILAPFLLTNYLAPALITLCFIFAFLVKLPIFIFHLWLPKAHVEAPVAGSIILAGVLLKLGSYGLLQILKLTPIAETNLSLPLLTISLTGGIVTSLICFQQTDIKSLIAYASVAHIGLLLAGTLILSSWGWIGALIIMVAHGIASSGLFALANYTYKISHSRNIFLIKGLLTYSPSISFWWFLFLSFNLAAPPSLNFASEIFLITALLSKIFLAIIPTVIMVIIAAAYSIGLYTTLNHGQLSSFLSPPQQLPLSFHPTLFFHFLPILALIFSPTLIRP